MYVGGVRGTYKTWRQVLAGVYTVEDVAESAVLALATSQGAPEDEIAPAPPTPEPVAAVAAPVAVAAGGPRCDANALAPSCSHAATVLLRDRGTKVPYQLPYSMLGTSQFSCALGEHGMKLRVCVYVCVCVCLAAGSQSSQLGRWSTHSASLCGASRCDTHTHTHTHTTHTHKNTHTHGGCRLPTVLEVGAYLFMCLAIEVCCHIHLRVCMCVCRFLCCRTSLAWACAVRPARATWRVCWPLWSHSQSST